MRLAFEVSAVVLLTCGCFALARPGGQGAALTGNTDMAPTILNLTGLPVAANDGPSGEKRKR